MKTEQLLETLEYVKKRDINNGIVLLNAYLQEWFRLEEGSMASELLSLQAVAIVHALHTDNHVLVNHLTHHVAKLWNDTYFNVKGE